MPIYMKYTASGKDIVGDVTAKGYEKQIECHSFQWGIGRQVGSAMGSSKNRQSSAPSITEITLVKDQDDATAKMIEEALDGKDAQVVISFVRTGSPAVLYLQYTLTNVVMSGYSIGASGDRPTETISLNFTKVQVNVIPEKPDATEDSKIPVIYDLALMQLNP
jgi:type VI secretion system secreted protein Hcp